VEIGAFFRKSGRIIIPLTVGEIPFPDDARIVFTESAI
jgi:hypothetical protein